jgi:putative CocE/NonD family hydrolase
VGGAQLTLPSGPREQSRVESRADVLVFTGEPLSEPLEVVGRVRAELWARSDAPDTDFVVKLCDVYPDGRSFNVVEGLLRARFRESPSREVWMKPGRSYRFDIDLWSTAIVFNKGHRLRVQVASSSSPGYEPNPQTGESPSAGTTPRVATNTILLDQDHPSHLLLPIVR